MPDKSVFIGTGAFMAHVDSASKCKLWLADSTTPSNLFDHARAVGVDLSLCPSNAAQNLCSWNDVQVEDFVTDGGPTSIGKFFPRAVHYGAIYLEENFWNSLGPSQCPAMPPTSDALAYEFKTVVYWTSGTSHPRTGMRYFGFHAKVRRVVAAQVVEVDVWNAGTSQAESPYGDPLGRLIVDLAATMTDLPTHSGGLTEIGATVNHEGALFLEQSYVARTRLTIPKLPPGLGGGVLVHGRRTENAGAEEAWSKMRAEYEARFGSML